MAVYREGYHIVSLIEKNSKQIFSDAADYGAPVKKGDTLWNAAKQLAEWYGIKETRKEDRYSTGRSCEQIIELMDECAVSDQRKTEEEALDRFKLYFTSCDKGLCKGYDGFITIEK